MPIRSLGEGLTGTNHLESTSFLVLVLESTHHNQQIYTKVIVCTPVA